MTVISLNKDIFQKEVLEYKGVVLVDFYAVWCGPCKIIAPIIDQLSEEKYNVDIKFIKINVDENQELARQYNIFSIPAFIFFKNGKLIDQFSGALSKEEFAKKINGVILS